MAKLINAILSNNIERKTVTVTTDQTVKQILVEAGLNYDNANIVVDSVPISLAEFNKTLSELGIDDTVRISAIVKTNNA